jgi:hypothetical protein
MSRTSAILASIALGTAAAHGQVTFTATTVADAFVASGSSNNPDGSDLTGLNFGGAGTLVIAPAASVKGEFRSLIRFDLSGATNLFNSTFGTNWIITAISLELTSNYGTAGVQPNNPIFNVINGGKFVIEWMSDDSWIEGTGNPNLPTTDGVTFSSLPSLLSSPHQVLGTNVYVPPGDNVHVIWPLPLDTNLVANAVAGGPVTFYFYAADDQVNYLFSSYTYGRGNQPLIHVTAIPLLKFVSARFTNGLFHLTGLGATNAQYQVQFNPDPTTTNWQTLATVTSDSAGTLMFDDTSGSGQSRRFYRLVQ